MSASIAWGILDGTLLLLLASLYSALCMATLQALKTAEASHPDATRVPLDTEAARQCQMFQYKPAALGMVSYPIEVLGFVPQPWYERLLKSGHMQASHC